MSTSRRTIRTCPERAPGAAGVSGVRRGLLGGVLVAASLLPVAPPVLAMSRIVHEPSLADHLPCTLRAPAKVRAGDAVPLRFTLGNPGDSPLFVLRWNTPWEGRWMAEFVDVLRDGVPLRYAGAKAKRGAPQAGDWMRIAPASSQDGIVDLAQAFDLSAPGRYHVMPRIRLLDARAAMPVGRAPTLEELEPGGLACADVEIVVRPR